MGELLWALWVFAGGRVHGGYLEQPYVAAYFKDSQRVRACCRADSAAGTRCAVHPGNLRSRSAQVGSPAAVSQNLSPAEIAEESR